VKSLTDCNNAYANISTPPVEHNKRDRRDSDPEDMQSDLQMFNIRPIKMRVVCTKTRAITCKEMYADGPDKPRKGYTPACLLCKRLGLRCTILDDCSSCEKCAENKAFCGFVMKNTVTKYDLTYTNSNDIRSFLPS
jgi:hypothetical protein